MLYQKPLSSVEDKVDREHQPWCFYLFAEGPHQPEHADAQHQFVKRGWIYALHQLATVIATTAGNGYTRVDRVMRILKTPGPIWQPVEPVRFNVPVDDTPIPIAGQLAAYAANTVSQHHTGRANVCQVYLFHTVAVADIKVGKRPKYQSAIVSKAVYGEKYPKRIIHKLVYMLQCIKQLGTNETKKANTKNDEAHQLVGVAGLLHYLGLGQGLFFTVEVDPEGKTSAQQNPGKEVALRGKDIFPRVCLELAVVERRAKNFKAESKPQRKIHQNIQYGNLLPYKRFTFKCVDLSIRFVAFKF